MIPPRLTLGVAEACSPSSTAARNTAMRFVYVDELVSQLIKTVDLVFEVILILRRGT